VAIRNGEREAAQLNKLLHSSQRDLPGVFAALQGPKRAAQVAA
jgi:hypothetical protein